MTYSYPDDAIIHLANDAVAYRSALDAVEALHTPTEWIVGQHDGQPVRQTLCACDAEAWPCSTVRAIREALA